MKSEPRLTGAQIQTLLKAYHNTYLVWYTAEPKAPIKMLVKLGLLEFYSKNRARLTQKGLDRVR